MITFLLASLLTHASAVDIQTDVQEEALRATVERVVTINTKSRTSSVAPCEKQKSDNRYASMKDMIVRKCTVLGLSIPSCTKVVEDTFEIASPYCPTGSLDKQATNCTMMTSYILQQFSADSGKFGQILEKIVDGMKNNVQPNLNIYDLVLEASNGNKADAILTMNLMTFGNLLIPEMQKSGQAHSASLLTNFFSMAAKSRKANVKVIAYPPGFEKNAKQFNHKGYHFWTRALLASQLHLKGHSKLASRTIATSTSIFYEFKIDWQEHKSQGMRFEDRLKGATADVKFSDLGSKFGVD